MDRFISHVKGTKKSGYLLIGFSLLFPLGYSIATSITDMFNALLFWEVFASTLLGGIGLWIILVASDYHSTERLKNRLMSFDLMKLLDGNLKLIDQYNGWSREIKIEGTFENRKISIDHTFRQGNFGQIPYLLFAIEPLYHTILEVKADKLLTVDELDRRIRNVLAVANA